MTDRKPLKILRALQKKLNILLLPFYILLLEKKAIQVKQLRDYDTKVNRGGTTPVGRICHSNAPIVWCLDVVEMSNVIGLGTDVILSGRLFPVRAAAMETYGFQSSDVSDVTEKYETIVDADRRQTQHPPLGGTRRPSQT